VAENEDPSQLCAQCGYDLRGLSGERSAACPECGAVAGMWRSVYSAPWLVAPALRLLVWAIPILGACVCMARLLGVHRGGSQHSGLIVSPDAVLLYAIPLLVSRVGVTLLVVASPRGQTLRTGLI